MAWTGIFLKMCWSLGKEQNEWKRRVTISKKISADDNVELASWLVYMFQCTLKEKVNSTGLNIRMKGADVGVLSYYTRSFTAKVSHGGHDYVFKRWYRSEVREARSGIYRGKENRYLKALKDCSWICRQTTGLFSPVNSVWLEYGGSHLRSSDISGDEGRRLAKIVKKGIWEGGLPYLREHMVSHNDIHEANIVLDGQTARLIDFESCSGLADGDGQHSPTVVEVHFKRRADDIDQICTAGVLSCLWEPATAQFPKDQAARTKILRKFVTPAQRTALIQEIPKETVQRGHSTGVSKG